MQNDLYLCFQGWKVFFDNLPHVLEL